MGLLLLNTEKVINLETYSMKKIVFLLAIPVLLFVSCSKKNKEFTLSASYETGRKRITIGYSIDTLAIERWRRDLDIFLNTASELGDEVIVQNAGNSIETQIKQIQYLIDRRVDAIVIVAKEAKSLTDVIHAARNKNIPVLSYDRLILNAEISAYLTIDSYKVGRCMAESVIKKKPYGSWFCMFGPESDYNMTFIKTGIEDVLRDYPRIHINYVYYTEDWNYDLSYEKMAELIAGGILPDAVIAGNDAVANSIIKAIAENNCKKDIIVVGQDCDITACQNIIQKKQTATVYKPINELAERTARIAHAVAQGINASDVIGSNMTIDNGYANIPALWLEPESVDIENIDQIIIKSGFHTESEVYRN